MVVVAEAARVPIASWSALITNVIWRPLPRFLRPQEEVTARRVTLQASPRLALRGLRRCNCEP